MRKIIKICFLLAISGSLLVGIGSGVAFAEYSSIEYGGKKEIVETKNIHKSVMVEVDSDMLCPPIENSSQKPILFIDDWENNNNFDIETDKNVPKDSVKITVDYQTSSDSISIFLSKGSFDCLGKVYQNSLNVYADYNSSVTDIGSFVKTSRQILNDLKHRKLYDYADNSGVKKVVLYINPDADFTIEKGQSKPVISKDEYDSLPEDTKLSLNEEDYIIQK